MVLSSWILVFVLGILSASADHQEREAPSEGPPIKGNGLIQYKIYLIDEMTTYFYNWRIWLVVLEWNGNSFIFRHFNPKMPNVNFEFGFFMLHQVIYNFHVLHASEMCLSKD